jgi:hypothetical protein
MAAVDDDDNNVGQINCTQFDDESFYGASMENVKWLHKVDISNIFNW